MYFASSVALAVAPATPGIGNVTTGLPAFPRHDVWPIVITPSWRRRPRSRSMAIRLVAGPGHRGLGRALRTGPQADEPLLHGSRHRRGLPFPGNDLRARDVFVPGVQPADDLDVRIRLPVGRVHVDLRPLARRLVVGADAILRQRAGLPVHLHGAVALILERDASSCSSTPRSMPMCHVQLKSTDSQSLASAAGVKSGGPPPRPCAPAVGGTAIARTVPSATANPIRPRRKAMVFSSVGATAAS